MFQSVAYCVVLRKGKRHTEQKIVLMNKTHVHMCLSAGTSLLCDVLIQREGEREGEKERETIPTQYRVCVECRHHTICKCLQSLVLRFRQFPFHNHNHWHVQCVHCGLPLRLSFMHLSQHQLYQQQSLRFRNYELGAKTINNEKPNANINNSFPHPNIILRYKRINAQHI